MRYSKNEDSVLVGEFPPGTIVTIKVLVLDSDSLLTLNSNVCNESSQLPGLFMWGTTNIADSNSLGPFTNLLYQMDGSNGQTYRGKFVYGGYPDITDGLTDVEYQELLKWLYIINSKT